MAQPDRRLASEDGAFVVLLTDGKIDTEALHDSVARDEAGAISSFSGTTRNNFEGKKVVHLEYEAYDDMALKEMMKIVDHCRSTWDILGMVMSHRLGVVPVRESSIYIVVASAHRQASLEAVQYAINEAKAKVPVWKKEVYEEGEAWKENKEFFASKK